MTGLGSCEAAKPAPLAAGWVECGAPAVAVHVYRCEHDHERRGATCAEHIPAPGLVGCRAC